MRGFLMNFFTRFIAVTIERGRKVFNKQLTEEKSKLNAKAVPFSKKEQLKNEFRAFKSEILSTELADLAGTQKSLEKIREKEKPQSERVIGLQNALHLYLNSNSNEDTLNLANKRKRELIKALNESKEKYYQLKSKRDQDKLRSEMHNLKNEILKLRTDIENFTIAEKELNNLKQTEQRLLAKIYGLENKFIKTFDNFKQAIVNLDEPITEKLKTSDQTYGTSKLQKLMDLEKGDKNHKAAKLKSFQDKMKQFSTVKEATTLPKIQKEIAIIDLKLKDNSTPIKIQYFFKGLFGKNNSQKSSVQKNQSPTPEFPSINGDSPYAASRKSIQ